MNDHANYIQRIKLRSLDMFPQNKMFHTFCDGVVRWWEYFEPTIATCVMEHDRDFRDPPSDEYMRECLEEHYGKGHVKHGTVQRDSDCDTSGDGVGR